MTDETAARARSSLPPLEVCHRARESRDARFDGLFYTAVRSTRVYCRSVCPAPTCKRSSVVYYPTAAAAQAVGYRPCLRCRPELAPGPGVDDDAVLRRALVLVASGFLADAPVDALAAEVGLSARHLRRRFVDRLGATPLQVHATQRLLLAKQFLSDTHWPIAQVAAAAGFVSVRRFNAAFRDGYRMAPREMRRRALQQLSFATTLRLHFRPPLDYRATLAQLAATATPGLELVIDGSYLRAIGCAAQARWLRVDTVPGVPGRAELRLELFGVPPPDIPALVRRVRRLFDLDADWAAMAKALSGDAAMAARLRRQPGLRLPGVWDGFELAVRTLLASAGASTPVHEALAAVIGHCGQVHPGAPLGLGFVFPSPERLAVERLETIGIAPLTAQRIRALAVAVRDRTLHFDAGQAREPFVGQLRAATGLPEPDAQWIALRALGDPDACPLSGAAARHALAWQPWRAYGCLYSGVPAPSTIEPAHA